jgi:tetratricopeptide (TPR) repeat protein
MKGILMLKEVIEEDPNNELALLNLGLFSMQSGQYEKAIDRFKILISVNPKNGEAKIFLGQSYAGLGKNQEARKIFEEVIKNETDSLLQMAAKEYLSQLK